MTFSTNLWVTEVLFSFRLVPEGKTGKKLLKSSRLESPKIVYSKQFCFIRCRRQLLRSLNKVGIADFSLMRTLLAIREMSQKPSFGEVVDSFVLLAYAILAACRTNLQWLIACVKIFYISAKVKIISMSYGSCTSSWKPLKMSWAWPVIYD